MRRTFEAPVPYDAASYIEELEDTVAAERTRIVALINELRAPERPGLAEYSVVWNAALNRVLEEIERMKE